MAKRALAIGINDYPDPDNRLEGCINDADDWASFLHSRGYDVGVLANAQATRVQILGGIERLIAGLKPGDAGAITFSGHGTWLPDLDGDETDGRDEYLCPYDMDELHLVCDDELYKLFRRIPARAKVVFITDCCHSGSVLRSALVDTKVSKARYVPPALFVTSQTVLDAIAHANARGAARPSAATDAPVPGVVHFAGCTDREYSYDASFGGRPNGAFTHYLLKALKEGGPTMTANAAYAAVRRSLPSRDYRQTPRLNVPPGLRHVPVF